MYIRIVSAVTPETWIGVQKYFRDLVEYDLHFVANVADAARIPEVCKYEHPDVVVMDPGIDDGVMLRKWRSLKPALPELICVSDGGGYALTAFDAGAANYLVLPCSSDLVENAMRCLQRRLYVPEGGGGLMYDRGRRANVISLPDSTGYAVRPANEVVSAHAEGAYTRFEFENDPHIIVSKSLGEYEDALTLAGLVRVHRSHMVSVVHIRKLFRGKNPRVLLNTGKEIIIGNSYVERLINALNVPLRKRR